MAYLLDTDTCIDALRGAAPVLRALESLSPDDCAVSSVTVFELMTGAEKAASPVQERTRVERFLACIAVLPFDTAAALSSAGIRALLEKNGTPIGPYDLLIAGHAVTAGRILVTRNGREFSRVPNLTLVAWDQARRKPRP